MTPEKCPWCKAQPSIEYYSPIRRPNEAMIKCAECGAMGPAKHSDAEAVAAWNKVARGEHVTERV